MPEGPLPDGADARVMLIVRAGCHLCDEALPSVRGVCAEAGAGLHVVDVDSCDPEVRAAWTDHVPVTVVDRRVVSIWFADLPALRAALALPAFSMTEHGSTHLVPGPRVPQSRAHDLGAQNLGGPDVRAQGDRP